MGLIAGVGDFGLTELQETTVIAKNTATTKASEATASANLAKESEDIIQAIAEDTALANQAAHEAIKLAQIANLQGVRLGGWNALTNSPTLTADASSVATGGYYDVTVAGTSSITGTSTAFGVGDRVAKSGATWYRIPYAISEKSVGIAQTNFIQKIIGKNLFNYLTAVDDFYMGDNGTPGASTTYAYSDFIEVESSTQYYGASGSNGMRFTCFYNSSKTVISGGNDGFTNTFTTTSATKYVRITVFKTDKQTFQLEKGAVGTGFEIYAERNVLSENIEAANNSIASDSIKSGAITPEKVSFLALGKNNFNYLTATDNFYVGENGVIDASATYCYSDYIKVNQSTDYYGIGGDLGMRFTCFYDENKDVITGGSGSLTNTFTTTSNTHFVRITIFKSAKLTFQLEEGTSKTDFERYGYKFDTNTINNDEVSPVEIAIAPKLYTLNNAELAVYYENIHKNPKLFEGKCEISGSFGKQTSQSTKFTPTSTGTSSVSVTTANDDFDIVNTTNSSIVSVNPTNNTAVKILNFGDSHTYGRTFTSKLSAISSNVTFLGIRTNPTLSIQCEGRGGYTLSNYFTLQKTSNLFSPFMQPGGAYKYYGVTGFWKLANASTPDYEHGYYDAVKSLFNPTTGYKASPATNDVMYDDTANAFYFYNGSAWATITESTLAFSFNFAKYRSVWGVEMPDIIHVHLGTNDWYATPVSGVDIRTEWNAWKTKIDTFITSAKADNANVKIIIGIPNPSGKQGGIGILTTEKSNRNYWIHAKNIITHYANRESEKIYVADYHSTIDRECAFSFDAEVPFSEYTGTHRNQFMPDFTHLSVDGYNQMGNIYAAMIQFLR